MSDELKRIRARIEQRNRELAFDDVELRRAAPLAMRILQDSPGVTTIESLPRKILDVAAMYQARRDRDKAEALRRYACLVSRISAARLSINSLIRRESELMEAERKGKPSASLPESRPTIQGNLFGKPKASPPVASSGTSGEPSKASHPGRSPIGRAQVGSMSYSPPSKFTPNWRSEWIGSGVPVAHDPANAGIPPWEGPDEFAT